MATNVPSISWLPSGPVVPSAPAILAGRQLDFNTAFGTTFAWLDNSGKPATTPQAQLASSEAAIISNVYQLIGYYAAQVDPAYAVGRMQDAIARIYFLARNPALPTVLQVTCLGGAGVVIPDNSNPVISPATIQDTAGNLYICTTGGTIPGGGSITLPFSCTVPGPTAVPASNGVSIYQAIPGWDSATVASGVVGVATESRAAFEGRRQNTVAANSQGPVGAIVGAVAKVPGVLDYFAQDNPTNSPVTIGGVSIAANSMYVCVAGGTTSAIASAILSKKPPGCSMTGTTTVTAFDSNPLYSAPIPYSISFTIAAPLRFLFNVLLVNSPNIPTNATTLVQAAVIAAFTQGIVGTGAVFVGSISGSTLTVTSIASGAIAVGQTVTDNTGAVAFGQQILAFGSGTGGTGTYTVSVPQTVASETMNSALSNIPAVAGLRARIGQTVYVGQFVQAVNALGAWAQIASMLVGASATTNPPYTPRASFTGAISGSVLTVSGYGSGATGTVTVGDTIFDANNSVPPGTTILSNGTGSGGNGTYNISQPLGTIAAEAMVTALANQASVAVRADQVPQLSAPDIIVGHT